MVPFYLCQPALVYRAPEHEPGNFYAARPLFCWLRDRPSVDKRGLGPALECDQSANPVREEVAPMPFSLKDGVLTAGDAPGLGVEVDRSALERFLVR